MKFKGTPIYNYKPRHFLKGGFVKSKPNMTKKQLNNDSVLAILQPNEIVIPVKHKGQPLANQIKRYLINNNIYLPHF
jgi:hypothetical protein